MSPLGPTATQGSGPPRPEPGECDATVTQASGPLAVGPRPGDRLASTGLANGPPGYEVVRELGRGGMGVVYLARQVKADRLVALKMILPGAHASPKELARFRTEAEAIARIQHPHIVQVFEVGEHDAVPFFSLEYCAGGSLATKLNGTPQEARPAAQLVEVLARATQAAHEQQVIHRDLKPANVLLTPDGAPKVTDFGLAKKLDEQDQTQTGSVMGTPSYMAPEQAEGKRDVGPLADVYALGAVLYECLTGRPPFKAATLVDTLFQVLNEDPVPPSRLAAKVPRDLETICLKCLHKQPQRRYPTALALADDLGRWQRGEPVAARPVRWPERALKGVRRRPAVAGLLAGIVLLTLAALAATTGLYRHAAWQAAGAEREARRALTAEAQAAADRDYAQGQEKLAGQQRDTARAEKKRAESQLTRAERLLYASQIQAAQREWEAGNVRLAWEHLSACRWDYRGLEHRYLFSLFNHNQVTFPGHSDIVTCVASSSDGSRLVSGGFDKTVKVWDGRTGKQLLSLTGHSDSVYGVACSADGSRIVSGGQDATVKVWDGRTGKQLFSLTGHGGAVKSVACSADGSRIVSGGFDKMVKVWDGRSCKQLLSFQAHAVPLASVAWGRDGSRLVSADTGRSVKVWDARTGKQLLSFEGHSNQLTSVAWSGDGGRVATGSLDRTVKVWDARTGKELHSLSGHSSAVTCVAWSDDGARIVSGSWDKTVRVWDANTGKELLTLKGHSGSVHGVALSADARRIVSGGREVKVWDAGPGANLSLAVTSSWSLSVAVSGDGSRLVNGGQDGAVTVWDTRTGASLVLKGHSLAARSVAVSEDGSRIVSGSQDGAVKVWDGRSGELLRSLPGHTHGVQCVALCADGSRIVSGNWDKTIKVWDGRSGELLLSRPAHAAEVRCVAISADGSRIASGSLDGAIKVWDGRSGKELFALTGDTGAINSVALSADGSRLVSGSGSRVLSGRIDGSMKVWDTRSGKELLALSGHSAGISSVALSADGTRIVSGAFMDVKVWDARTGKELLSFGGHTGFVNSVALSADGRCIASGDSFGNVKVWRATAEQDHVFLRGPTAPVRSVALSTDGKQLLAQDDRGKVFAWSAVTGQSLPDAPARLPVAAKAVRLEGKLSVSLEGGRVRVEFPEARKQWQARDRALLERLSALGPRWHRRQLEGAVEAGDDFAAAYHLERLLRAQPWDASLHVRQASALARLGRHQQAATHLMHALFLNPRVSLWPVDPGAATRGDRAAEAGDWPRAVRELQIAARQPQAPSSSLSNLLLAQLAARDTAGARQTMAEVAQRLRVEKDPRARSRLAYHAQAAPWDKGAAAVMLEHVRGNLARKRNASTLDYHGFALYRAGRFAEAEKELAASVKAHGKGGYVDTWLFQAMTARQLGKHDEALRQLARFEARHARQKFPTWQQRAYWEVLLAEARKTVHTPPPMPRLGTSERPAADCVEPVGRADGRRGTPALSPPPRTPARPPARAGAS